MAVKSEPSNDDKFKMWKDQSEETSIIGKDNRSIIWTFLKVFPSKTYETIKLFILHMLMSILKGRLQGRNLLGLMLIIYLLLLCGMAPSAAYADIPECSPGSRSPNDSVLDADDVKSVLFDSRLCNFSHQGYEHVCEDAFDHMLCPAIHLTGNRLSSLPSDVLRYAVKVDQVFLDGNSFLECPQLRNDNVMFLSINDNPLVKFSNQSTNSLPNLTILSVENCPNLLAIDEAAFENNLNLRVRFSGTPLQKLPSPCSNCSSVTLEGPDTVHLMCGSGSAIVTFESEIGENVFLNKTVEMFLQTNDSSSSICINQANSETHSTNHTSLTPTSVPPTSATPASVTPASATPTSAPPTSATPTSATPASATPTSAPPTSATPTSATPASATPASATTTSAILTLTTPASVTPTSATPTAVPKSATPRWTATLAYLIPIGVVLVLVLVIFVMVWYRKAIQSWCQKRSGIPNEILEMVPQNEP